MSLYGKPTHGSASNPSIDSGEGKNNNFSLESFFRFWFLYMSFVIILDTITYLLCFSLLDDKDLMAFEKVGFYFSTTESIIIQISVVLACATLWCLLMFWSRKNNNKILLVMFLISIIIMMIAESQPIDLDSKSTHWIQLALQAPSHTFNWIFDLFLFFSRSGRNYNRWIYDHYKLLYSSWIFYQYLQGLIGAGVTILALVARKPTNKIVKP